MRRGAGAAGGHRLHRWAAGLCWLAGLAAGALLVAGEAWPEAGAEPALRWGQMALAAAGLAVGAVSARRLRGEGRPAGAASAPAAWYGLVLALAGGTALLGASAEGVALSGALACLGGALAAAGRWLRWAVRGGGGAADAPAAGDEPAPLERACDRLADLWGAAWGLAAAASLVGLTAFGFSLDRSLSVALWLLAVAWPAGWALAVRLPLAAGVGAARRQGVEVGGGALLHRLARLRAVRISPAVLAVAPREAARGCQRFWRLGVRCAVLGRADQPEVRALASLLEPAGSPEAAGRRAWPGWRGAFHPGAAEPPSRVAAVLAPGETVPAEEAELVILCAAGGKVEAGGAEAAMGGQGEAAAAALEASPEGQRALPGARAGCMVGAPDLPRAAWAVALARRVRVAAWCGLAWVALEKAALLAAWQRGAPLWWAAAAEALVAFACLARARRLHRRWRRGGSRWRRRTRAGTSRRRGQAGARRPLPGSASPGYNGP